MIFKPPGDLVTAKSTSAVFEIPFAKLVPVAHDEKFAATGAPRAATVDVVDVARVNVVQPFCARDLAGADKRRRWCMRFVEHFEIGMERREMPRHIRPEIFREPLGRAMERRVAVVLAWNQQRGDFEPNVRFVRYFSVSSTGSSWAKQTL